MKAKPEFSLKQNPLQWHKRERYKSKVATPDVERWKFQQVYDYALWLENMVVAKNEVKETED